MRNRRSLRPFRIRSIGHSEGANLRPFDNQFQLSLEALIHCAPIQFKTHSRSRLLAIYRGAKGKTILEFKKTRMKGFACLKTCDISDV
jgi:hypothetical protein